MDDDEGGDDEIAKKVSTVLPEKFDLGAFSVQANKFSATDGNGPTPKQRKNNVEENPSDWEWDGTIDEEAHLGLE